MQLRESPKSLEEAHTLLVTAEELDKMLHAKPALLANDEVVRTQLLALAQNDISSTLEALLARLKAARSGRDLQKFANITNQKGESLLMISAG